MMEIKCWGSRGSIPVSGKQYEKYGGDTTCIQITAQSGETIIVDGGTGIRRLGDALLEKNITRYHLLFTHAHWDHILGLAFFRPMQFSKVEILIQDRIFFDISTQDVLNEVLKQPFFPIGVNDLNASLVFKKELNKKAFQIGSVKVETIPTSHPGGGLGYKFTENDTSFVFLTDNELGFNHPGGKQFDEYRLFCKNADLLIHDAEYTAQDYKKNISWGHSLYTDALDLAIKANVKKLGLFHLNQNRSDEQMDEMVKLCTTELKQKGVSMECFAVASDMTFTL
ncbi:MAG: MBL fold metallo-hydrolase [Pseudomonadota bacterium]